MHVWLKFCILSRQRGVKKPLTEIYRSLQSPLCKYECRVERKILDAHSLKPFSFYWPKLFAKFARDWVHLLNQPAPCDKMITATCGNLQWGTVSDKFTIETVWPCRFNTVWPSELLSTNRIFLLVKYVKSKWFYIQPDLEWVCILRVDLQLKCVFLFQISVIILVLTPTYIPTFLWVVFCFVRLKRIEYIMFLCKHLKTCNNWSKKIFPWCFRITGICQCVSNVGSGNRKGVWAMLKVLAL